MAMATFAGSGGITVVLFHLKQVLHLSDRTVGWIVITNGTGAFIGTQIPRRFKKVEKPKLMAILYGMNFVGTLLFLVPVWWFVPIALFAS